MAFPLLSLLPLVSGLANKLADAVLPDNMSEGEKHSAKMQTQALLYEQMMGPLSKEMEDLADARLNERTALENAGKFMNSLRAGVTIFGGYSAQAILFWNIISPYFGYNRVQMHMEEYAILGGIVAFYYGKRLKEKLSGVSTRQ